VVVLCICILTEMELLKDISWTPSHMFDGCIWEHNLGNGAFFGRKAEQFVRVP
jgi:hypothetical protein